MKIDLKITPKNPIIIEGFPGFGLIGTITTEFLIEQLKAELIGTIKANDLPAMIAIHEGKVVQPLGIYYDKKTNIMIVHIITNVQGMEWELSDAIVDMAKQLKAKEIICLEGVASPGEKEGVSTFYYTTNKASKVILEKNKIPPLKEGIILGVTGSLLLEADNYPLTSIFVEAHSALPDSKAAAEIIKVLDKLLGMNINPAPLMDQAERFEKKIKGIMERSKMATDEQMKKKLSYVG
jgi:uncharacterized protein